METYKIGEAKGLAEISNAVFEQNFQAKPYDGGNYIKIAN